MTVEGGCIAIVGIDRRQANYFLECFADGEASPVGVSKVGRSLGRNHTVSSGRARCIETHTPKAPQVDSRKIRCLLERDLHMLQRYGRSLFDHRWRLQHL